MGIEDGGDKQERNRQFIRNMFIHAKLNHDFYNVWHRLPFNEQQWHKPLEPFKHYAEESRIRDCQDTELVMELSDPEAVAAYDQLVDEFNAAIPEINKTKDFEAIKNFWERARKLIYSERE